MDLRELVRLFLADYDKWTAHVLAEREDLRERGARLVQHQQTAGHELEVKDAITGEHLFTGPLNEGLRLFESNDWAAVDSVDQAVTQDNTIAPGIPSALQDAVREWVDSNVEEAREFAEV